MPGPLMRDSYKLVDFCDHECIAPSLYAQFIQMTPDDYSRQTHLVDGRYENIYLEENRLPVIEPLLGRALSEAAKILEVSAGDLQIGFWFNLMQPGHTTSLHSHDDDDELLSGVYYLQVPEASGDLILHTLAQVVTIVPVAGRMVFFSPRLLHEVTRHNGVGPRVSIAFNIGRRRIS